MTSNLKVCLACAEDIKLEAKLCKHCGTVQRDFNTSDSTKHGFPKPSINWNLVSVFTLLVALLAGFLYINFQTLMEVQDVQKQIQQIPSQVNPDRGITDVELGCALRPCRCNGTC